MMLHRGNGRTIKIPVRTVERQLPAVEEEPRPLLTGLENCQAAVVEAKAEVEAEVESWKQRAIHWQAEAENARALSDRRAKERFERRIEIQLRQERQRLLARLLAVADNLERALAHSGDNDALHTGVQLTLDDLRGQLAQEGVEALEALGQPFDPRLHEAVASDGSDGETVVEVLQTGYTLNGELLRPARVVVGAWVS